MDKQVLKRQLCDILINAEAPLCLNDITDLYNAQFHPNINRLEIQEILHELYHAGKVIENRDRRYSDTLYTFLRTESEQKPSQIEISKWEVDSKRAEELKRIFDSSDSSDSDKWAAEVLLSLPRIEKRKDNKKTIDFPVRDIIKNGKIDEVCKLLKQNMAIREIFFTRCNYWPVIREIMIYIASKMPDFFSTALSLYANNNTGLLNEYSANYVKDRALQGVHRYYDSRIQFLMDCHQYGERFIQELMAIDDSALSLDEVIDYLNLALCHTYDTKYRATFISVYNEICYKLVHRHNQKKLCEAFLNTEGLAFFFMNISDISLLRTMLDTIEAAIIDSFYYGYKDDGRWFRYSLNHLSENPFLSEKELEEFSHYYPFLSKTDEPKIFADNYSRNVCSICNILLETKRVNIAANNSDGSFYGVFVQYVHVCPRCGRIYVTNLDRENIRKEVHLIKSRKIVRYEFEEDEGSKTYRLYDRNYLDLPVINMGIDIDIDQINRAQMRDDWGNEDKNPFVSSINGLSDESFLRAMGYNTEANTSKRHEILDAAIGKFGKRRIIDMLQFYINMRKNQTRSYSYAISIWSDDIQYVINH